MGWDMMGCMGWDVMGWDDDYEKRSLIQNGLV